MQLVSWPELERTGAVDKIPYRMGLPLYAQIDGGSVGAQDLDVTEKVVYYVYNGSWSFKVVRYGSSLIAIHSMYSAYQDSDDSEAEAEDDMRALSDDDKVIGPLVPISEHAFFNSHAAQYLSPEQIQEYREAGNK